MDQAFDAAAPSADPHERQARAIALPAALTAAWLAVIAAPGPVRLITMWLHESGHAVAAWMCGYPAWPGPWFTPIGGERSPVFAGMVLGILGWGAYRARQLERGFWFAVALAALAIVLVCTLVLSPASAQQLITLGGDAGSLVLGTALMLTVYARADHPVRTNQLRWGLLAIGALAFADAFVVWTGPESALPLGENENGLSDPSVLIEGYGWTLASLTARYQQVALACLAVQVVVYAATLMAPAPGRFARRQG